MVMFMIRQYVRAFVAKKYYQLNKLPFLIENPVIFVRLFSLLQTYWQRLTMVARAGGYYGKSFRGREE